MGLLDYFDPDALRGKLKGLLGGMPISQMAQGRADFSGGGLKDALMGMPIGPDPAAAYDAAMAMGPLVAGMTKWEKAHKVAQKNATKMLGLPPDNTAADRAKALGFDTKGYRGSLHNEVEHNKPIWWSEDPEYSNMYAKDLVRWPKGPPPGYVPPEPNMMPLLVRRGKEKTFERFSVGGVPEDSKFVGFVDGTETGLRRYREDAPVMGGKIWEALTVPKNVRSRFAAFDPARVNENDLLAAYFGFPMPQYQQD